MMTKINLLPCFATCFLFACQTIPAKKTVKVLDLRSPFYSSVPNLSIYNAHTVARDTQGRAKIIRGMRPVVSVKNDKPVNQFDELNQIGVTDVLILKENTISETKPQGDVEFEKEQLARYKINVTHQPIAWKDYTEFKSLCSQSLEIFKLFDEVLKDPKRKLFFHCTVGEDRTGFLTGLYKVYKERIASKDAFDNYMCKYGYGDGNPGKPKEDVVNKIHAGLTPIYVELSQAIGRKRAFTADVCTTLPDSNPQNYWDDKPELKASYTCKTSSLYAKEIR